MTRGNAVVHGHRHSIRLGARVLIGVLVLVGILMLIGVGVVRRDAASLLCNREAASVSYTHLTLPTKA